MLNFVLGRAGSGKTTYLLSRTKELASKGQRVLLIMPEQGSFTAEKAVSTAIAPECRDFVGVTSFSKLARDVFKRCGGAADSLLSRGGSAAVLRRAVQDLGEEIKIYRRALRDTELCSQLAGVVDELRNAGIGPQQLLQAAESSSAVSAAKYRELAHILSAFAAREGEGWIAPATGLARAAEKLPASGIADGATVFFDGFSGFTEPQFDIIKAIMRSAAEVYFLLQDDCSGSRVFSGPAATRHRLCELAKELGTAVAPLGVLQPGARFLSSGTAFAESWFAGCRDAQPASEGVCWFEGEDRYREAELAAAEISYLVREKGWRYRDFTIAVREVADYRSPIGRTFKRFGIPVFFDSPRSLSSAFLIRFAKAAVGLLSSFDSEKLLTLAGGPFSPFSLEELEALESYCFIWNLKGYEFKEPFTKNPGGIGSMSEGDKNALAELENMRQRLMEPVLRYLQQAKGETAGRVLEQLYRLLWDLGCVEKMQQLGEEDTRECSAAFSVLDALYNMLGQDRLTPEELVSLISIESAEHSIADIPRSLEQVTVSGVARMRTDEPKAVFCMGLVQGEFPKERFDSPILSFRERDELNAMGGRLSLNFDSSALMEKLYLYRAVSAPTQRLYLSRPCRSLGGSELPVCSDVENFLARFTPEKLCCLELEYPNIVNPGTALAAVSEQLAMGDDRLLRAFLDSDLAPQAQKLAAASAEPAYEIKDKALAGAIAGGELVLSPTKVETYQQCPFQYFLRYTLGIKPLRRAAVDPMTAGSFVHGVLEIAMKEVGGDLLKLEPSALPELAERSAKEYMARNIDPAAMDSGRVRALASQLSLQASRLLARLREEREQSRFLPTDFELKIAKDGDAKPRVLQTPEGVKLRVEGTVDRVDLYTEEDKRYLRVVDYKTGEKKFDLDEVLSGINLQMLIYLFSLTGSGPEEYRGSVPSGVLYMPADPRPPAEKDTASKGAPAYRMDGLVLEDAEVVRAMEEEMKGRFIPVAMGKNGFSTRAKKTVTADEMRQLGQRVDDILVCMARDISGGGVNALPVVFKDGSKPCEFCDYRAVCRSDRIKRERPVTKGAYKTLLGGDAGGDETD